VNTAPQTGTNIILVTHKTNLADAFAKEWIDVKEGEAAVFKPAAGSASMVARIPASEWSQSKEASR
jgi:ABC-type cobalamin/Fe3+-siderophores transport system ATPase subunit